MLKYKTKIDPNSGFEWIETSLSGKELLQAPLLNKGTAFTFEERVALKLLGKLPYQTETLEQQVLRAKNQYNRYSSDLQKFIYLNHLHDSNEVLFYKLILEELDEMLPKVYTPGVGAAVKEFSHEFRQPRGLYISYPDIDRIEEILDNRTHDEIDLIVVTDGERILGLGDQGIGGMDIPIAKLVLYSLCGVNPYKSLPIMLDVGTDNSQLINDPVYLGWRHARLHGEKYDQFIEKFVSAIKNKFPRSFLHWEDFGMNNARRILEQYRKHHCSFNDDMQGTGVVTLAALLAAISATKIPIENQRVIIFGAGTAGIGIADQLCNAMVRAGLSKEQAHQQFWLIDRQGLMIEGITDATYFQRPYLRPQTEISSWPVGRRDLKSVVETVKPTVLIGCSTVGNSFTEAIVTEIAKHVAHPIIFPLSNPNENCEASPEKLLKWTQGRALIATGSPYDAVEYNGKCFQITQCNNAFSFPGIGLGVLASGAQELTDNMLWVAAQAISELSPVRRDITKPLLPVVKQIPDCAIKVAIAVAKQAMKDNVATKQPNLNHSDFVREQIWIPYYRPIKCVANVTTSS